MSSQVDRSATRPAYVAWILFFVTGFSVVQILTIVGLYYVLFGAPTISEWFTMEIPNYSNTALWNGRCWFSVMKVGPANPTGHAMLRSIDPEKGDLKESKFSIPFPTNGFVADGNRLWVISPNSVTRIEGEVLTEFKTLRSLSRPSEPFLYDDQIAVVDMGKNGPPMLLVFQDKDWVEIGPIVIPFGFTSAEMGGNSVLAPIAPSASGGASLLDFQVVAHKGRFHTFLSDGTVVAYREGLELAPVSALAPANVSVFPDLSNVGDWDVVCHLAPSSAIRAKHTWRGAIHNGQPVVVTISSSGRNLFQSVDLSVYGRLNDDWIVIANGSAPASIDLITFADDQQTYVSGQSLMQTLRILKLTDKGLAETGVLVKAPDPPFQTPLTRWVRICQWGYWIGLLFFALGISRLMVVYRESEYQFGKTTVELASFTRRVIARSIDYAFILGPGYMIAVLFGLSNEEDVQKDIDKFFDLTADGLLKRLIMFVMCYAVYALTMLIINSGIQGRWGVTMGKWICGIRTVRRTLRPCGFARALVRELLLVPETLLNNAVIPVTLVIAFSQYRQRVGDMVADTIVIRKRRLAEPEFADPIH